MDNDQTIIMIHAFLSGQMSDQDRTDFQAWLDESADNRLLLEQYREVWSLSENYSAPSFNSSDVRAAMPFVVDTSHVSNRNGVSMKRWSIAASLLVIIAAGLWLFSGINEEMLLVNGSFTSKLKLEDGSVIYLRDDARLKYPAHFDSDERDIVLEDGEAYFDIASDESRRFVVETEYADITVLGTEFDVDINDGVLEVHVTEGKVRIDPEDSDLFLELTAGESAFFDTRTGELRRERSSSLNDIAWYTKRLTFKKTEITSVAAALQEAYDVTIKIENPALKACTVTSNYVDKPLAVILADLAQIYGCKVIQEGNDSYALRGGSCN